MTASGRYADRPGGRGRGLWLLIAVVALAIGVPLGIWSWSHHIQAAVAKAREWTVVGAPCPTLTRQAYLAGTVRADRTFQLGDFSFGRAYGHASCDFIACDGGRGFGDFPVCQFTSPSVLDIKTRRGEFYFFPSSYPATVSIPHGLPQCVMAANFKG